MGGSISVMKSAGQMWPFWTFYSFGALCIPDALLHNLPEGRPPKIRTHFFFARVYINQRQFQHMKFNVLALWAVFSSFGGRFLKSEMRVIRVSVAEDRTWVKNCIDRHESER